MNGRMTRTTNANQRAARTFLYVLGGAAALGAGYVIWRGVRDARGRGPVTLQKVTPTPTYPFGTESYIVRSAPRFTGSPRNADIYSAPDERVGEVVGSVSPSFPMIALDIEDVRDTTPNAPEGWIAVVVDPSLDPRVKAAQGWVSMADLAGDANTLLTEDVPTSSYWYKNRRAPGVASVTTAAAFAPRFLPRARPRRQTVIAAAPPQPMYWRWA